MQLKSSRSSRKSVSKKFDKLDLTLKMIQQANREYCAILPHSILKKMDYETLLILSQRLFKVFYNLQHVNMPFVKMDEIGDIINNYKILEDLIKIFYLKKKPIKSRAHRELLYTIFNAMDGFYFNSLLFEKNEDGIYFYKHVNLLEIWDI